MKIADRLARDKFSLSFEVFPPVRDGNIETLYQTIEELKTLDPSFISVTYGAGGSTRDKTIEIASKVHNEYKIPVLAHLTCVQSTKNDIAGILDNLTDAGIENILALRGDPPAGEKAFVQTKGGFKHASELVTFIAERQRFSIGVAAFPEKHPEAASMDSDLQNLKRKVDAGASFAITQLFFNNEDYLRLRDRALALKIQAPIIPGIFPILNYKQLLRIVSLCGATIPPLLGEKMQRLQNKPEEIEKYGIEHAILQARALMADEVRGLHIYSMNRSAPVMSIVAELPRPAEK